MSVNFNIYVTYEGSDSDGELGPIFNDVVE